MGQIRTPGPSGQWDSLYFPQAAPVLQTPLRLSLIHIYVSRTPLRDALRLLENEGWIEQVGKNRKIAVLMWKDILELFEIREPCLLYTSRCV